MVLRDNVRSHTVPIAALVDASVRTWVDVDANGYDERTSGLSLIHI